MDVTSPTQMPSHVELQQYSSLAHTQLATVVLLQPGVVFTTQQSPAPPPLPPLPGTPPSGQGAHPFWLAV